jgi:hypothetical protein
MRSAAGMSATRRKEVGKIFHDTMRKMSRFSTRGNSDLVSLYPYNAHTAGNPNQASIKNYLAEAVCGGQCKYRPKYVLDESTVPLKNGQTKAYQLSDVPYYDEVERQQFLVSVKEGLWKDKNDNPVNGRFIYGVDKDGQVFFLPRLRGEFTLDKEECEKFSLDPTYSVTPAHAHSSILSAEAGFCFGYITVQDGKTKYWDNATGHYRCSLRNMGNMLKHTNIEETFSDDIEINDIQRISGEKIKTKLTVDDLKNAI